MAKRLVAKIGTYEKDGQTKGEYVKLGVILENDNGEYALIDPTVNLSGVLTKQNIMAHSEGKPARSNVMCSLFTDQPQTEQNATPQAPPAPSNAFEDDDVIF